MAKTIEKTPAVAGVKLWIRNGAPYSRGGIVQVPWSVVAEAIPGLSVDDELEIAFGGSVVPAQVDVIQKTSDSAVVVFALPSVGAGDEHYHSKQSAVIRRRTQPSPGRRASAGEREGGVYFNNDELDVWFSLSERHGGSNQRGGAATTVQVNRFEVLDAGAASKHPFAGHDARKCAMQIDSIRMWRPPWDEYEPSYCDFSLAGQPWTLVASGGGAVRGWATLASPPFDFSFRDLTAPARCSYNCRLYRTISLFAGADYLIEDVAVRGAPVGFEGPRDLAFAPHYFMWSHFGLEAKITHYADIPDWFAVGCRTAMPGWPGYGFATTAHVGQVENPAPAHARDEREEHKSFGWSTEPARHITSLHYFQRETRPPHVAHNIGNLWYTQLLKPLRAEVAGTWREGEPV